MLRRRLIRAFAVVAVVAAVAVYFLVLRTPTPEEVAPTEYKDNNAGLPSAERFAELAKTDPIALLDVCLSRYTREHTGFRATLEKQERLNDTLHPPEVMKVSVREKPVAVADLAKRFESWLPDYMAGTIEH